MFLENLEKQFEIQPPSPTLSLSSSLSFEFEEIEPEEVEEITRVPTPPPLPPIEPNPLGPDNIPGPPKDVPVKLDENPVWDPIRPYLPSLVWLEQYKPGLIEALFEMVNTLGHESSHECTLKRVIGLKDRFALSSEVHELPKQNEASSQTNFRFQCEVSTQTIKCFPHEAMQTKKYNSIQTDPSKLQFGFDNAIARNEFKIIDLNSSGVNWRKSCDSSLVQTSRGKDNGNLKTSRVCWNCRQVGHPYSYCTELRRIFCQMCGRHGYTAKTCPNCGETWRAMGPYYPKLGYNVPRRSANTLQYRQHNIYPQ